MTKKLNVTNEKKIFKRTIALELRNRGFKIIRTEPNRCKPQFDVYLFEDTPWLRKALDEVLG